MIPLTNELDLLISIGIYDFTYMPRYKKNFKKRDCYRV